MAGEDHPIVMRKGRPFLHIRDGLQARIQRSVFYRLVEEGEQQGDDLFVYSNGSAFNLGSVIA